MAITVQKGEVREIGIEVTSSSNESFVIDTADYKVFDTRDKDKLTPLQEGGAEIQGTKIILLFSATDKGTFDIEITYRILPEILKADILVSVR